MSSGYRFIPEEMTWNEHDHRAREMGGHLASITSAEENEQVTKISGGKTVWIGGIRKGTGNGPGADHWHWSDGQPWTYTNWHPGEPNNYGGGENRVHLGLQASETWNDVAEEWRGPAVYRIHAIARKDFQGKAQNVVSQPLDETAEYPSRGRIGAAALFGIFLMILGLPLLIIGSISTGEDNLAMLIPGAILTGVGSVALISLLIIRHRKQDGSQKSSIDILEATTNKGVYFRINNPPTSNDAWVGIYPPGREDTDHGEEGVRWHWLRDIDVNKARFYEKSEGRWSIRVFSDSGFTLNSQDDFEILPKSDQWWEADDASSSQ